MAHRIAQNDGRGAAANCRRIEPLNGFGIGAHGIFRYEHVRKAVPHGKAHRMFDRALQMVGRPVFDQPSDRARTQECGGLDGNAGVL